MICPTCSGSGEIEVPATQVDKIALISHLLNHGGLSYMQIAEKLHLHKSTIGYYVTKYKLRQVRTHLITNPDTQNALVESGHL